MLYVRDDGIDVPYGSSRAWVAWKLQIPVPAIANDWAGRFKHWERLYTIDDVLAKFKDPPSVVEFTPFRGLRFWGSSHVHLDEDGKEFMDLKQELRDKHHLSRNRMQPGEGKYYYGVLDERSDK